MEFAKNHHNKAKKGSEHRNTFTLLTMDSTVFNLPWPVGACVSRPGDCLIILDGTGVFRLYTHDFRLTHKPVAMTVELEVVIIVYKLLTVVLDNL